MSKSGASDRRAQRLNEFVIVISFFRAFLSILDAQKAIAAA